jgi:cytochrome P450
MYSSSSHDGQSDVAITPEWCADHFDHLAPVLGDHLHPTLGYMREHHPVAHSDRYGGFWVVTRYEDVLRVVQDWRTFSNAEGAAVPPVRPVVPSLPLDVDPPVHTIYKRLINGYLTPGWVSKYEPSTRELAHALIDEFIADGRCDFMAAFARPFPGRAFFGSVLNAPPTDVARLNELSLAVSMPTHPAHRDAWQGLADWVLEFVEQRRHEPPRGDVVDAVLAVEVDGRPIATSEILGVVQLLITGGLDTTAGALGHFMLRFTYEPEIPARLRENPQAIPAAIEELLRLDGPFLCIARTATCDTDISSQRISKGDKVLVYWASANRDPAEFPDPATFDPTRQTNRHLAFGAGPHRCAGSNLARMNLRIALEALTQRLRDVELDEGPPVQFHSTFSRAPLSLPLRFAPCPRRAPATASP